MNKCALIEGLLQWKVVFSKYLTIPLNKWSLTLVGSYLTLAVGWGTLYAAMVSRFICSFEDYGCLPLLCLSSVPIISASDLQTQTTFCRSVFCSEDSLLAFEWRLITLRDDWIFWDFHSMPAAWSANFTENIYDAQPFHHTCFFF